MCCNGNEGESGARELEGKERKGRETEEGKRRTTGNKTIGQRVRVKVEVRGESLYYVRRKPERMRVKGGEREWERECIRRAWKA